MRAESELSVPEIAAATYTSTTEVMPPPRTAQADDEVVQLRILPRADASFVTHLIAIQQQSPQTRTLRRATSEDALAAYRSTAHRSDRPAEVASVTRRSV
ncbi:hypothetical protein [Rhodopseudomonas palustris]|uniref:Uncharacterized protein n=1 Tax=Rhodopseudomonas palustris (strain BisB18) TaxID=316056 RepID=Q21C10_RHOPB